MSKELPIIETNTGDVFLVSASGNVIDTVKTDPRLVPNQSVGISVDGSEKCRQFIQITKKTEMNVQRSEKGKKQERDEGNRKKDRLPCQLTTLLCITINER